uniref:Uncharacterized protein n=1 Tax=Glossina pallidipes TaxID=7398 RepID=A0A1A9Z2C7_GLOPL
MKHLKALKPVEKPDNWADFIVLVKKANENYLRLCIPGHPINQLHTAHFLTRKVVKPNTVTQKFSVAAKNVFWMVPLTESSTTFCTYQLLKLLFGINAVPEIFHAELIKTFGGYRTVKYASSKMYSTAYELEAGTD